MSRLSGRATSPKKIFSCQCCDSYCDVQDIMIFRWMCRHIGKSTFLIYLFTFIDQERLRNASPMKIGAIWNSRTYIRPPQSLLFNIYYFCFSPNCLVLLQELHQTQASLRSLWGGDKLQLMFNDLIIPVSEDPSLNVKIKTVWAAFFLHAGFYKTKFSKNLIQLVSRWLD